ncbi:MAG: metallophosphoesterase [Verrucomicrobiales bacterium]|nr:metallophosphoesterase [Verrucomicrobiales bacterium]
MISALNWRFWIFVLLFGGSFSLFAQTGLTPTNQPIISVDKILPPLEPLPDLEQSVGVTNFSFIVYGDTRGRRDGKEVQYEHSMVLDAMLSTIKKQKKTDQPVRFVLQSGDAVVDGRDARQWNKSFVSLINRVTQDGGLPYFLAPGNHDLTAAQTLYATGRVDGLINYLQAVKDLIPPDGSANRLSGYPCYSFGYGNCFVVALDSNIAGDPEQLKWATQQFEGLDRNRFKLVFAFFHHSPFSSGSHGGATVEIPTAEMRKKYMPLFRKYRVRALFAGHEHLFEHWVERYANPPGITNRMDIIVTGGGGAPLMGYKGEPDLAPYIKTNATEHVSVEHIVKPGPKPGDNPYHFVLVKVRGEELRTEVVAVDWGSDFKPYHSNGLDLK